MSQARSNSRGGDWPWGHGEAGEEAQASHVQAEMSPRGKVASSTRMEVVGGAHCMGWWLAARHVTGKCCCLPLLLERLASLALVGPVEACSTPSMSAEASKMPVRDASQVFTALFTDIWPRP